MKHTENFTIGYHDTDVNGLIRTTAVLRYMQEAANLQLEKTHPTQKELEKMGLAFVISKINMSIYVPLDIRDEIKVQTWIHEVKGATFQRVYKMYKGDMLAAEAVSIWAIIGIEDKRIHKASEVDNDIHHDAEMSELDMPRKINIPENAEFTLVGERTIYYSDVDRNGHMNNTCYPDMLCSFLPDMIGKRVVSMFISFISEAPLGETLKVYLAENDGIFYFRTMREDGRTNIEAKLILD